MPRKTRSNDDYTVVVSADVLRQLVDSIEGFWDDHSFAKTQDNPGWKRDHAAIKAAHKVLRGQDG